MRLVCPGKCDCSSVICMWMCAVKHLFVWLFKLVVVQFPSLEGQLSRQPADLEY